jgi:hypothetical protein
MKIDEWDKPYLKAAEATPLLILDCEHTPDAQANA